jgi:hypothetical protein
MLVRNRASLGIENQRTKRVKTFRSNCIDFCPTTTMYYAYSTIKAPDKGEVGGSSPPRPTIQIISKYAVILTFPLFGDLPQKTVLSTVCQLYDWPDGSILRGVKTLRVKAERLASISHRRECCPVTSKEVQGGATHCKAVEGAGSHFKSVCGGVVHLVRTPPCHAGGRGFESRRSRQFQCVRPLRRHAGPGGHTSQYKRVFSVQMRSAQP